MEFHVVFLTIEVVRALSYRTTGHLIIYRWHVNVDVFQQKRAARPDAETQRYGRKIE
jgi:hypothetical protein